MFELILGSVGLWVALVTYSKGYIGMAVATAFYSLAVVCVPLLLQITAN